MLRFTRVGGVAAALAIGLLVAVSVFTGLGTSTTFADVLDKLEQARSVRFVAKLQLEGQPVQESRMWIQGDMVRIEVSEHLVTVMDSAQRKALHIYPQRKAAELLDLDGQIPADELRDPIDQLRKLKEQEGVSVTELGDELLDQRMCRVYRVDGAKALRMQGVWKLWVDRETNLPVQMRIEKEKSSVTLEQMVWESPLDPSLFSLAVPEGFDLQRPVKADVNPGQMTYHIGRDVYSMRPDGTGRSRQFAPESNGGGIYESDKAELSPDGRYLAIAYPKQRDGSMYPPDRILMWDRTQPEQSAAEVYALPGTELSHWRFSADGNRLYVAWWKQVPDKSWPHGMGAEFIDIKTGARTQLELPTYINASGEELPTEFADVSPDGRTYLVVGQHLQLISADSTRRPTLTKGDFYVDARSVRFSPDGQSVLYVASLPNVGYQLCRIAVAGGEPQVLVAEGQFAGFRARWSPDGSRIAMSCRKYNPNHPRRFGHEAYLKIMHADGTGLDTILSEAAAPNGKAFELTAWR